MSVCAQGDTESACKSKVGNLQVTVLVNEQILRLEVAVEDAARVEVIDALDELLGGWTRCQHGGSKRCKQAAMPTW